MNKSKKIAKLKKKIKKLEKTISRIDKPLLYFQMPLNKNGDLLFDFDEVKQLHNQAVEILGDKYTVFTSWADIQKL